jgi:hypothetical protein
MSVHEDELCQAKQRSKKLKTYLILAAIPVAIMIFCFVLKPAVEDAYYSVRVARYDILLDLPDNWKGKYIIKNRVDLGYAAAVALEAIKGRDVSHHYLDGDLVVLNKKLYYASLVDASIDSRAAELFYVGRGPSQTFGIIEYEVPPNILGRKTVGDMYYKYTVREGKMTDQIRSGIPSGLLKEYDEMLAEVPKVIHAIKLWDDKKGVRYIDFSNRP